MAMDVTTFFQQSDHVVWGGIDAHDIITYRLALSESVSLCYGTESFLVLLCRQYATVNSSACNKSTTA